MKLSMTPQPRRHPFALIAAVAAVLLIGVSFAGLAQSASAAKPVPGKKIVALTPFSANAMALVGVQPKAVGEVLNTSDNVQAYSPLIEKGIRRGRINVLPLTHPNGPNLETLAKQNAKLVFTSPTWSKGSQAMRALGLRVQQSEPKSLQQVYSGINKVAKIVGKKKKTKKIINRIKKQVRKALPSAGAKRPRVMVILGVGRTPFTFLPNSWGGEIVKRAGGDLITGGATNSSGFARISDEVVVAEDPDVIIAVPHATRGDIPALTEYMQSNPAWSQTSAVENERLYFSLDNSLLQAGVNPAKDIRNIRKLYLKN